MYTGKSVAKHSQAQIKQKARWMALGLTASIISLIGHVIRILQTADMLTTQDRAMLTFARSYMQDVNTSIKGMDGK